MATIDNWWKGFCIDGGMDISITKNEIYQNRGGKRVKTICQQICNRFETCVSNKRCVYSGMQSTKDVITPRIIVKQGE